MSESGLINVFQDRRFTGINIARVQNVRGSQLSVETYYFKPGQSLRYHRHPDSEQAFIFFSGEGVFYLDSSADGGNSLEQVGETTIAVKPGSIVLAPAGVWHSLANTGGGELIVAEVSVLPLGSVERGAEVH